MTPTQRTISAVFLVLSATAVGALAGLTRTVPVTEPGQVAQIAPGVFFREGDLKQESHCNNGFVVFEDFVLVIDANFPDGAEACLEDIRKETDKPVRFVFDTHHHGDHAYGNSVWRRHGALPVAQENFHAMMAKYEPTRWRESVRKDVVALGRDGPMPPVITYPKEMTFDDGKMKVDLLYYGTAHTPCDGFAYLPKEKILFTGDTVVNGPYNYMGDGNTQSWIEVLDALLRLDVEIVAPGHGQCAGRELIQLQRRYINTLHKAVRAGMKAGKDVAQLQVSVRKEIPAELERYVGMFFEAQIEKVYTELKK